MSALQQRAALNRCIRDFFEQRGVLEVETPLLMRATAAEQHLQNFRFGDYALQTSPESAMKRLLCADVGPIYQLSKAFRAEEQGKRHNPEFTMLEWYQPDYGFDQIIDETLLLIIAVLGEKSVQRHSYRSVFKAVTGLCPHTCSIERLAEFVDRHIEGSFAPMSRSDWLDLIMSCCVEPTFIAEQLTVITEFPACQAALAKLGDDSSGNRVARRFEVYCGGLELANGYDEECNAGVLAETLQDTDTKMLSAFQQSNIQSCCGVALGVDRLLMLKGGYDNIADVLSFDFSRA